MFYIHLFMYTDMHIYILLILLHARMCASTCLHLYIHNHTRTYIDRLDTCIDTLACTYISI